MRRARGFTLLELLVVVAIIGLLVGFVALSFNRRTGYLGLTYIRI